MQTLPWQALRDGALAGRVLGRLALLVLDEADLLLSYGHEADLQAIAPQVGTRRGRSSFACGPRRARPCCWQIPRGFSDSVVPGGCQCNDKLVLCSTALRMGQLG